LDLKILHIWDICHNSNYLTQKLKERGHESLVVTRTEYSKVRLPYYLLRVIFHLLTFKADIIHINYWEKGVFLAKIFSPKSKILMHYHGSDIIDKPVPRSVKRFTTIICFSTRNLLETHQGTLLPILVPDWFMYTGGREQGTILELDQDNRQVPHELMPFILSLFEFYRDKKRRTNITSSAVLSQTGMEAIQCGTKVIADSGEIVESFPMTKLTDYYLLYNQLGGCS